MRRRLFLWRSLRTCLLLALRILLSVLLWRWVICTTSLTWKSIFLLCFLLTSQLKTLAFIIHTLLSFSSFCSLCFLLFIFRPLEILIPKPALSSFTPTLFLEVLGSILFFQFAALNITEFCHHLIQTYQFLVVTYVLFRNITFYVLSGRLYLPQQPSLVIHVFIEIIGTFEMVNNLILNFWDDIFELFIDSFRQRTQLCFNTVT